MRKRSIRPFYNQELMAELCRRWELSNYIGSGTIHLDTVKCLQRYLQMWIEKQEGRS